MSLETGYFADTKRWTKVHIVERYTPICGSQIKPDLRFQWCATGIKYSYIECEHCKRKAKQYVDKRMAN